MKDEDIASKDGASSHDDYINHRMAELKGLVRKLAESLIKFLVAANTAGIATIVSLLSSKVVFPGFYVAGGLLSFIFGLILSVLIVFTMMIKSYRFDKAWAEDTDLWYEDQITWGELNERDEDRTSKDTLEFAFAFLSFALFGCGVFFTLMSIATVI